MPKKALELWGYESSPFTKVCITWKILLNFCFFLLVSVVAVNSSKSVDSYDRLCCPKMALRNGHYRVPFSHALLRTAVKRPSTVRKSVVSISTNAGLLSLLTVLSPPRPRLLWDVSFTQVVREKLCELEIPHKFIASARGSPKVCAQCSGSWCSSLPNVAK